VKVWLSSRPDIQTPNNQEALLKFSRSWNATTCIRSQQLLATNAASVGTFVPKTPHIPVPMP
jgi:hypothetical protein